MSSESRPPVFYSLYFDYVKVVVVHRFECKLISVKGSFPFVILVDPWGVELDSQLVTFKEMFSSLYSPQLSVWMRNK